MIVLMAHGPRNQLLDHLAARVESISTGHPTRVALDGPPAAGKTTLADELAAVLRARGREVIRASIDDFLAPRERRYGRGELSGVGCYADAHDHDALITLLLDPLGPGGDRRYRVAAPDGAAGSRLPASSRIAREDAVLLFDGVFLMRPELASRWDLRVLLSVDLAMTVARAVDRDRGLRSAADTERRWRERYLPAQQLYLDAVRPADRADVIVHNDTPHRPTWEE